MKHDHVEHVQLLREPVAASLLEISARTLQSWRRSGAGPRYISLSPKAVRYRVDDIRKWLDSRVRTSTSDNGEARDGRS